MDITQKDSIESLQKMANACKIGELLAEIDTYTYIYEFNFQFWGKGNNNVYVSKGHIELFDIGGRETIEQLLEDTLSHLKKIKAQNKQNESKQ